MTSTTANRIEITKPSEIVRMQCQEFILSDEHLHEIMNRINSEIERGLSSKTHDDADVKCFPTYIHHLPTGQESGKYLALDLGGTNFRVLMIDLTGENEYNIRSKIYAIPKNVMLGDGEQLFDRIAECLATFIQNNNLMNHRLSLGFTFSFPLIQNGLAEATLVRWTKGFNCANVVDKDVVKLLKEAIARRGDIEVNVCAIINDTSGVLISCAFTNRNCKIGLIIGTGCNACYVEKSVNVETMKSTTSHQNVVINTEWGGFGDNGSLNFIRTQFDCEIDQNSLNCGKQIFEKMISGMYLGEIVRLILVHLTENGHLFNGIGSDSLNLKNNFYTKYISDIEFDQTEHFLDCREILNELGLSHASEQDCVNVSYICECVSRRAAHLIAAGISVLINRLNETNICVGVDGSVYRFHPRFPNLVIEKVRQLVRSEIQFELVLSEDGSGRGAALAAAVECRTGNNENNKN